MSLMALHRAHVESYEHRNGSASVSRGVARVLGLFNGWNSDRTDDEIGRFIQRSGGRLTDALEREIAERAITRGFGR